MAFAGFISYIIINQKSIPELYKTLQVSHGATTPWSNRLAMPSSFVSDPFVQSGDQLEPFLRSFWQRQVSTAEEETPDFRHPSLPLARIKKVMKSDPDVRVRLAFLAPNDELILIAQMIAADGECTPTRAAQHMNHPRDSPHHLL